MTEDYFSEDWALEIIASHGADAARWPDAEREALLALAGRPAVAAALAEAAALDALLTGWARADVARAPFEAAQLVPAPVAPAIARPQRRWIAAGAMAAAVVAAVVLAPMRSPTTPAPQVAQVSVSPVPSATAEGDAGSDAEFAYVFTPTVDEDALI